MTVTEKLATLAEMVNALAVTVAGAVTNTPELTTRERAELEEFCDELMLRAERAREAVRQRRVRERREHGQGQAQ